MKIFVTGTRGIPDIPGGVEKHCQEIYPLIVKMGHDVWVATRKPYVSKEYDEWKRVKLVHIDAPVIKSFEAIAHTFLAVIKAKTLKADIIHIHSVGPGLLVPLAKILGMRVVLTNHGPDYQRQKWGKVAKAMLRMGEYLGCKFADSVIVISAVIQNIVFNRCRKKSQIIYNGVPVPELSQETDYLNRINVIPDKYILAVSRLVPEKGLDLLIKAFGMLDTDSCLVIAGDADHGTQYSKNLKQMIDENDNIIRTGYITGEPLNQLFSHAQLFVLPSYHEGLPIALLEAMSYGLSVLVSDIPANLEVDLPQERFFKCGDIDDLKLKMETIIESNLSQNERKEYVSQIVDKYNWQKIAEQTVNVYKAIMC